MQQLLQSCDAHKFETTIHVIEDGKSHDSNVKVCGKQGQSDADWVAALKDMVDKTAAKQDMPQAIKDQVITALNAEIVRLTALLPREAPAVAGLPAPRPARKADLASDYSTLPPLPPPVAEPLQGEAAPAGATAVASVPAIPVRPPARVTVRCVAGRDASLAEPCDPIERGNMLLVEAQAAMDSGLVLRFFRRGEPRGELQLGPMRPGQPAMVALPYGLCSGIVRSRIEIRASTAPNSTEAVVGTYDLHC